MSYRDDMRALILFAHLMLLAFRGLPARGDDRRLPDALCASINFAKANGSNVGEKDLYHCHVLTDSTGPNETSDLKGMMTGYVGLICHAHEMDNKRDKRVDNFNILVLKGKPARFFGITRPAKSAEVAIRFLDKNRDQIKYANQVNFFNQGPDCERLRSYSLVSCGGHTYCYASAKLDKQYDLYRDASQDLVRPYQNPFSPKTIKGKSVN